MKRMDKSRKESGTEGLIEAVRELERVRQQAKALGIFTDDRELLECPKCGLIEDVTFEGLLVTYPKNNKEMRDCGLRFRSVDETSFECPSCGTRIKVVIL
jgi:predicted RNA-binding Zn-ribbon protein involved in translation (DUF1610 family)